MWHFSFSNGTHIYKFRISISQNLEGRGPAGPEMGLEKFQSFKSCFLFV
jgi:hypothetical protein